MSLVPESCRVLIVDDEKEACINLKNLLFDYIDPGINVVGVAHNTKDAEKLIGKLTPDAVFLDIEMPNENAFHFLDRIMPIDFEVIFVTAYDDYAVKAFKLNAIDYILKPISIPELADAVRKLKDRFKYKQILNSQKVSFAEVSRQVKDRLKTQRITLKDGNSIEVVEFKDIIYIEANGSYSKILFIKENAVKDITMSTSLSDYEELLPPDLFCRIHKSYLINCSFVKRILKEETSQVVIKGDIVLPVSRRRFASLLDFLKSNAFHYE